MVTKPVMTETRPIRRGIGIGRWLRLGTATGLVIGAPALSACGYIKLLRPNVLGQLNPRVVRLVNFLPSLDHPNEATIARLIGHGGLSYAKAGKDGVMRARVRVPPDQFIWEPSVVVLPRGGELELEFINEDRAFHAAILHSAGGLQLLDLPGHRGGQARIRLAAPGMYTFACPVANHSGRGMLGLIIVRGEVPAEAKLDRPEQPKP